MSKKIYSVIYSDEAVTDLKEITSHYDGINPVLKQKFKIRITEAEAKLLQNPHAFSYAGFSKFRKINLQIFPYKMIYFIDRTAIKVFGVFHHARSKHFVRNRLK